MRRVAVLALWSALISMGLALSLRVEPVSAQQTFEMKVATVAPAGTPWEVQIRKMRKHLREVTAGRVRVKAFLGGTLGGEKAIVRRTAQGNIQCYAGSTAVLGSMVPELNMIEAPYLFESYEQADRALDHPEVLQQVHSVMSERGFVFGFWAENGFRSFYTKDRAIRAPSDLRGLRMRSPESAMYLAMYRSLGANPVPLDVASVLPSLQSNVVDGFDNTPLFAFAGSWYQGATQLNLSRHTYQPGIVAYSKSWFDSLPTDVQQALTTPRRDLIDEGRSGVRAMDPILIRNLERFGIHVHTPSESERAAFAAATRSVGDRVARKLGPNARRLLKSLRAHR